MAKIGARDRAQLVIAATSRLSLAGFESRIAPIDHEHPATPADHLGSGSAGERPDRIAYLHATPP